jgi:hypothetical protein
VNDQGIPDRFADLRTLPDENYPNIVWDKEKWENPPNHAQMTSLFRKWKQSHQNMSWLDFAASAWLGPDDCVVIKWSGMFLAIETDGYCHS